jgi:filamentous hemagglutinin family protein
MPKRLLPGLVGALLPLCTSAGVVPDGHTATTVSMDPSGKTLIQLAPAAGGVSHNVFSRFDVSPAGAAFQNQAVGARSIVAEVRASQPSVIEGPVSVDGPRANLILANPNGLVINGGSFINFGSVALVAGSVALESRAVGNSVQTYVSAASGNGAIRIGPDGLAADLIRLELLARRIEVAGPLVNAYSSPTALLRLVAGDASALFDTAASPTDNLTPWAYYTAGKSTGQGIVIDLATQARISSGRIELLVTDAGAGVRNAGHLQATSGDFVIDSAGLLEQKGGRIEAAGDIRIRAGSVHQAQAESGDVPSISAAGSLDVQVSGSLSNLGGSLSGVARNPAEGAAPAALRIVAGADIVNQTPAGGAGAVIFGAADDVLLEAGGDIRNINGRVVSNGALSLHAGGTALNESVFVAGSGRSMSSRDERNWLGLPRERHTTTIDNGVLADPAHTAYWVADGQLSVTARQVHNLGGSLLANAGDVVLDAGSEILNRAWLTGALTLRETCNLLFCRRTAEVSESLVGGQILASQDVRLKAGERLLNDGGLIHATRDMQLDAPRIEARGVPVHVALSRADGLRAFFGDHWAGLYAIDQGGGFTAQTGRLSLRGQAIQDRGFFIASQGIDGVITVLRAPGRDPVELSSHLGIFSAVWR